MVPVKNFEKERSISLPAQDCPNGLSAVHAHEHDGLHEL